MSQLRSFEQFVRDYQNLVYTTALRLLGQPAEAEDVAQETFLRAYERFEALRQSPTAAGWLKTVTTRLALNHLTRYRNRWQFFSELADAVEEETDLGNGMPDFADPQAGSAPGELADRQARVHRALLSLPDHQRVPLVLYHLEGLTYAQIARELGISLGKVKTDIHRGRKALRRKLRLQLGDEADQLSP